MDAAALLCNICPKRPTFSDVSHLLTHVSSKGHLSNYFKLQVRSHQETEAGDLLDEYDLWYKDNNLPKLLSDRMATKEARKKQGKPGKHGLGCSVMKKTKKQPTPKEVFDPSPSEPLSTSFVDPRLSDSYLTMDGDSTLSESYIAPPTPPEFDSQIYIPPDYPLPPTASSPERPHSRQWKYECESEPEDEAGSFLQTIPIWDGRLRNRSGTGCHLVHRELSYDPFVDDKSALNRLCATGMDKERSDEMARLKGVLWPGMDIFDSATEQMRRKRNQKKDESILRMMETSSMCVEPTELVFSPTGILRKQRVISSNVEEDSPLPGESPLPKRISRPKRVLSQADPNAHYGQNKKRSKNFTGHHSDRQLGGQPRRSARISRAAAPQLFRFRPEDHYSCECDEGDDDFDLIFRGLDPKPRSGFSVFQDEPDDTCKIDLKDHHNQANPRPGASILPRQNSLPRSGFQSATHSSNPAGRAPSVTADKENIEPLLNLHDRVEPSFAWNSPPIKRRYASEVAYPPQFFFDDCPRVEFGPFGGHHEPPGYIYNPLAVSLPNLHEEDYIYFANANSRSHKEPSVTRGPSPDATIPEMEDDEFERFCFNGNFSL